MNECAIILSMINKYVLQRIFQPYISHNIFSIYVWLGLNNLLIYHLCMYLRGFSSYTYVCISTSWGAGEILYIEGSDFMVMQAHGSQF